MVHVCNINLWNLQAWITPEQFTGTLALLSVHRSAPQQFKC